MKVYLIGGHDEYGAEDLMGTRDPANIPKLIEDLRVKLDCRGSSDANIRKVADIIANGEDEPGSKHNLSDGWGGLQLYVVEIED